MIRFFDKLEDLVRSHLSRSTIIYSFIGGVGVVLFWRAVWETADILMRVSPFFEIFFSPLVQLLVSTTLLLVTGLMVSVFIGDRIILSGLRHEKKLEEKTEDLMEEEVVTLAEIREDIKRLEKRIQKLSKAI